MVLPDSEIYKSFGTKNKLKHEYLKAENRDIVKNLKKWSCKGVFHNQQIALLPKFEAIYCNLREL